MGKKRIGEREVLLEFRQVGDYVRVAAIDPETNIEVTIVGDPSAGEAELTRVALRKLDYVLTKRAPAPADRPSAAGKRGRMV